VAQPKQEKVRNLFTFMLLNTAVLTVDFARHWNAIAYGKYRPFSFNLIT